MVSDASLKSYLKKSSVNARIMCCFGVLEKENLKNFIPQITINRQPTLQQVKEINMRYEILQTMLFE